MSWRGHPGRAVPRNALAGLRVPVGLAEDGAENSTGSATVADEMRLVINDMIIERSVEGRAERLGPAQMGVGV